MRKFTMSMANALPILFLPTSLFAQVTESMPDTLTSEERMLATELAEQAIVRRELLASGPMYLVDLELLRGKEDPGQRQAVVTHYRYEGDLAILTTVDLFGRAVVSLDTIPHLPVRLSPEEVSAASELALADSTVQRVLLPHMDSVEVEPLLMRAATPDDPLFGHRVVRLLFRIGRGYLEEPVVTIDLTERRVIIGEAQRRP